MSTSTIGMAALHGDNASVSMPAHLRPACTAGSAATPPQPTASSRGASPAPVKTERQDGSHQWHHRSLLPEIRPHVTQALLAFKKPTNTPTYHAMITAAIECSAEKRVAVCDIFAWITANLHVYADAGEADTAKWKANVRHTLSMNKQRFVKVARVAQDGEGRGGYWTHTPGYGRAGDSAPADADQSVKSCGVGAGEHGSHTHAGTDCAPVLPLHQRKLPYGANANANANAEGERAGVVAGSGSAATPHQPAATPTPPAAAAGTKRPTPEGGSATRKRHKPDGGSTAASSSKSPPGARSSTHTLAVTTYCRLLDVTKSQLSVLSAALPQTDMFALASTKGEEERARKAAQRLKALFSGQDSTEWSVVMVNRWLDSVGFVNDSDLKALKDRRIAGAMLVDVDDEDLQEFGVTSRFERKRLLRALKDIRR